MQEFRPRGFQILPIAIKNILIINVLVLMAQRYLGLGISTMLDKNFALHYWVSPLFRPWQVATYLFMHGGWDHLIGNMFALWMFGSVLENVWGTKRFLAFYFICGIGAALCQMAYGQYQLGSIESDSSMVLQNLDINSFVNFAAKYHLGRLDTNIVDFVNAWRLDPNNVDYVHNARDVIQSATALMRDEASVGASGSVFGVLVAFGYLFPNMYLYFYFLFPIKAKWFVTGYILLELYLGIQNNAGDNVAHAAHIGGGIVGFLIVYFWNKKNRQQFY
ncbi:MAG: rhomboid family intramembrane serine protease [Chitinophagaceae bacterium]